MVHINVIQLFSYLIYIVVTFIYCRRPSYEESTDKDINACSAILPRLYAWDNKYRLHSDCEFLISRISGLGEAG
jgi:hypothetical protein